MTTSPTPIGKDHALKIIHAAMMVGATLFLGIVLFLHVSTDRPAMTGTQSTSMDPLTFVNFFTFFGAAVARLIMPPVMMKTFLKQLPSGMNEPTFAIAVFPGILQTHIVKLALLEGPMLFSTVVLMVQSSKLAQQPWLWVNIAPVLIGLAMMALTFPSKDRIDSVTQKAFFDYSMAR